jgi:hypothetical protein
MKQFRQGDVLLVKINAVPKSAKQVKEKIIAHGESSNHCHRVSKEVEVLKTNDKTYLRVNSKGKLEHVLVSDPETWTKEHLPVELEKGDYEVIQQREYDPYEKHIRSVQD